MWEDSSTYFKADYLAKYCNVYVLGGKCLNCTLWMEVEEFA